MVNKLNKYILVFFGIPLLFSCHLTSVQKKSNFEKKVIAKSDTNLVLLVQSTLDLNAIYVREWTALMPNKTRVTQYSGMKFYADNRFAFASSVSMDLLSDSLIVKDPDNFKYAVTDSIIKLEVWRDKKAGYGYWEGVIYPDSLVFYKVDNRKGHEVYIKREE